jgi:hypothetical protein
VYSALQPFSCILVHAISQSVSRVSSPLHTLSFRIPTSEILDPERYEIVRKDRTCKKGHEGGGVINAVRKDTVCSGEDTLDKTA